MRKRLQIGTKVRYRITGLSRLAKIERIELCEEGEKSGIYVEECTTRDDAILDLDDNHWIRTDQITWVYD